MFQFPSNGKVYPKFINNKNLGSSPLSFNSLQTGKYIQSLFYLNCIQLNMSFNSLQTGKYIQSKAFGYAGRSRSVSFNSLQTGKYIQRRRKHMKHSRCCSVSIPFKRESISKGKFSTHDRLTNLSVSIPFKRESISKALQERSFFRILMFQFPSNGKVYPKFIF